MQRNWRRVEARRPCEACNRSAAARGQPEEKPTAPLAANATSVSQGSSIMATQWGNNSLAAGASAGWFFARSREDGFLPVLQVMPMSPSFTDNLWYVAGDGYPSWNELGVSTIWSQLSNDSQTLIYFMVVENKSNNTIEYAFLESDL
jgi:hypothetical protein